METNQKIASIALTLILVGTLVTSALIQFASTPLSYNKRECLTNSEISVFVNGTTSVNATGFPFNNNNASQSIEEIVEIQSYNATSWYISITNSTTYAFTSFNATGKTELSGVDFYLRNMISAVNVSIYLLPCEPITFVPQNVSNADIIGRITNVLNEGWYNISISETINNSLTNGNLWYVGIKAETNPANSLRWYYSPDYDDTSNSYLITPTEQHLFVDAAMGSGKTVDYFTYVRFSSEIEIVSNNTIRISFSVDFSAYDRTMYYRLYTTSSSLVDSIVGTFDTNLTDSAPLNMSINLWNLYALNNTSESFLIFANVTVTAPLTLVFQVCIVSIVTDSPTLETWNNIWMLIPIVAVISIILYFVKKGEGL